MHIAFASLSSWGLFGVIGLGAVVAFGLIILGAFVGIATPKASAAVLSCVGGLILAVGAVFGAMVISTNMEQQVVHTNAQALITAAKATYGVNLSEQQAELLIGVTGDGHGTNRLAAVQSSDTAIGSATLRRAEALTPVALYKIDGTYRLYITPALQELPRV